MLWPDQFEACWCGQCEKKKHSLLLLYTKFTTVWNSTFVWGAKATDLVKYFWKKKQTKDVFFLIGVSWGERDNINIFLWPPPSWHNLCCNALVLQIFSPSHDLLIVNCRTASRLAFFSSIEWRTKALHKAVSTDSNSSGTATGRHQNAVSNCISVFSREQQAFVVVVVVVVIFRSSSPSSE